MPNKQLRGTAAIVKTVPQDYTVNSETAKETLIKLIGDGRIAVTPQLVLHMTVTMPTSVTSDGHILRKGEGYSISIEV